MTELMRFHGSSGSVVVEVDDDAPGFEQVSRGDVIADTKRRLDAALTDVRDAAEEALRTFRTGVLRPDGIEMEFGVKLNAEAGAVIAKTAVEGHFRVILRWDRSAGPVPEAATDAG